MTGNRSAAIVASPAREHNSTLDLASMSVRDINQLLHTASGGAFLIKNPRGLHAIAAGQVDEADS